MKNGPMLDAYLWVRTMRMHDCSNALKAPGRSFVCSGSTAHVWPAVRDCLIIPSLLTRFHLCSVHQGNPYTIISTRHVCITTQIRLCVSKLHPVNYQPFCQVHAPSAPHIITALFVFQRNVSPDHLKLVILSEKRNAHESSLYSASATTKTWWALPTFALMGIKSRSLKLYNI